MKKNTITPMLSLKTLEESNRKLDQALKDIQDCREKTLPIMAQNIDEMDEIASKLK